MKQKQKEHGHQAKPTAHINNPLDKPEYWVFRDDENRSAGTKAKSWFEARATCALLLESSVDELICTLNPCVPSVPGGPTMVL
jgi:hypothetical protein